MRKVVSVSLGSSKRDHEVLTSFLGQDFSIQRIGTDGDMAKAVELIQSLDGEIDAFGMGGIDLYIVAGKHRYTLRDAKVLKKASVQTPMVDGSGLKNTLERRVIEYLDFNQVINFREKKVLLVCGVDRFGMAESLEEAGATVTYGDLIFGLGISLPIGSLKTLEMAARVLAPIASQLPFEMLYPIGENQEVNLDKFGQYYQEADIIAGDFLFIKRYLPRYLAGKTIITNTVTQGDIELLRTRGVARLITTTPEFNGRSFGTNVMEACLVALTGNHQELTAEDYNRLLDKLNLVPRILDLREANLA